MSVTFTALPVKTNFHELLQELSAANKCRQAASKSPKFLMLYTKPTVKANPRGRGTAM
jgi:hypothetical protein